MGEMPEGFPWSPTEMLALPRRQRAFLLAQAAEYSALRAELAEAKAQLMEHEDAEATVCPEDVGFAEYIGVLTKQLAEAKAEAGRLEGALSGTR